MSVELRISFSGSTPGLEQQRLSMGLFAEPFRLLVNALQRTASGLLKDALDDPAYGSRGGQIAKEAKLLDLELRAIEPGSAVPVFDCVVRESGQQALFPSQELAELAVERVLRDIENEGNGKRRSSSVRKYLEALPAGIAKQRYTARRDNVIFVDFSVEKASLAPLPVPLARLIKVVGSVVSVGFPPGQSFVGIKVEGRNIIRCDSTPDQANAALDLRNALVTAAILEGKDARLLWIRSASDEPRIPTTTETFDHISSQWGRTMEILAQ